MGCFKVVEGFVKYRVGRRWKQRWCILQKLSPVSSCVHLCLHKGGQPQANHPGQPSVVHALEDFCGIEAPFQWDHEQHIMAIVCRRHVVVLALADKSTLDAWCLAIRCHLGCDHRFLVEVVKAPLILRQTTLALLFVHGPMLCLTTRSSQSSGPPSILASWTVFDLCRFGVLENKFCFQVNDINGLSVYALSSVSVTEIDRLVREATRKRSTSISTERINKLQVRDELKVYHRRSSHTGTSSLDSSSIYALLNFDSSPENGCTDCLSSDTDNLAVPVDRLSPGYYKDGINVGEGAKYYCKKERSRDADRTSVTSSLSAVPNHYIDSLSVGKKQLVVSLPDADASEYAQSKTSEDSSKCCSVEDKLSTCNGVMSLLSTTGDSTALLVNRDKVSLPSDAANAEHCSEVSYRRYSCGDQFAATWWRLLDHAASFSDLRGLPRSLSRFCCSTWRTFTGVKSACIDVSKVGVADPLQPSEASRLNVSGLNSAAGDNVVVQSVSPWWHKPVSPDRRKLIETGSESSSVCGDSPYKVNCNQALLDNAPNPYEAVTDGHLSDSDGGGSYVSLRVHCQSSMVPQHTTLCDENVSQCRHSSCDILNEDDTLLSAIELSAKQTMNGQDNAQKQIVDVHNQFQAASGLNCGTSVPVSRTSPSTMGSCISAKSTHCDLAVRPCPSFTYSFCTDNCSLPQSDQLLHPNNGYVNLSLGMQSSSLDKQSATFLSDSNASSHGQSAKVSAETKSVPDLGNDPTVELDKVAVHVPCSANKERLSCNSSLSSSEPVIDKSSKSLNRLMRLIRRSSTKAHRQSVLPATYSSIVAEGKVNVSESPRISTVDPVAVAFTLRNDQLSNVHRLPSPSVPPPPVPDDSTTSRLFHLCHSSVTENLPIVTSIDNDSLSHYEDLSFLKACSTAKKNATLSSSYSAGDKQHYESQSLKSSTNDNNIRLLSRTPSHHRGHVRQSSLELVYRPRCTSDRSEVMSVQSSGSDSIVPVVLSASDTTRHYSTTSRLRPRYGTEYQRIERRFGGGGGFDIVDDCSTSSSTPQPSPYSIGSSSVFTFDTSSCDGDDPPPPLPVRIRRPEPTYINIAPHSRTVSDSSPVQLEVNYAEIDHSGTVDNGLLQRRDQSELTPYAAIDLEATAAAAQTGREHARLREGLLHAKSFRQSDGTTTKAATLGRYNRPRALRKWSMPTNVYKTSLYDVSHWQANLSAESGDCRL